MLVGGGTLTAQQSAPPRDTTVRAPAPAKRVQPAADTAARRDASAARDSALADTGKVDAATLRRRKLAADTVKAPIARAEMPVDADGRWHWAGETLRASGAVTLADLLARIPGVTAFRANWIPAAQYLAYNGDPARVRVFLDGVELDPIDVRNPGVLDLSVAPIWQLEEVSAERGAGELRVHLRTWRVDRTMALTRTDILTGSENTNLYRGFFGKRLHNGGVIQLAAQQLSTVSPRTGGDGSSLQFFARVGWASKRWTVDGVWNRAGLDRAATVRYPLVASERLASGSPAYKGAMGSAYARVAWGDPDVVGAPWAQLVAATQSAAENSKVSTTGSIATPSTTVPSDTVDTATSRSQYVLSAGASKWGVNGSATSRLRVGNGRRDLSNSVRLAYAWRFVSLGAFAETRGADSTRRIDLTARVAPWRWLVLTGAHGTYTPSAYATGGPAFTASRLEMQSTWWGITLTGGGITRALTLLSAPRNLDSTLVPVVSAQVKGVTFGVRGPVFKGIVLDVGGIRWDGGGAYRPQMDVHTSLILDSSFPGKFPRNNFHLFASGTWDHRTSMFFPTATGGVGSTSGSNDVLGARLEIRIESGTVFFQSDNIVGKVYETAPGYMMPRRLQLYGLRWTFWN
jgi:hypothetical protein